MEAETLEGRNVHAMPGGEVERIGVSPREQLDQRLAVIETRAKDLAQRHGRLATGIAVGAAAAFALGMVIYRRRQKTSIMRRAQRVIPESVWEMPEELIAQLKKRAKRAV